MNKHSTLHMLQKALLCLSAGLGLARAYYVSLPVSAENVVGCGTSIEEAKQLQCRFDFYSVAYYPPACFAEAEHELYSKMAGYEYEWGLPDQSPIPALEVVEGKHMNTFATPKFHEVHCIYEWRRLIRALAEKRPLDKKLAEYTHSRHCSHIILKKDKSGYPPRTEVNIMFGTCGLTPDEMFEYGAYNPKARN